METEESYSTAFFLHPKQKVKRDVNTEVGWLTGRIVNRIISIRDQNESTEKEV
ncbi:hypothetical protein ACFLVB_01200 [Chloroflexota bacterium]